MNFTKVYSERPFEHLVAPRDYAKYFYIKGLQQAIVLVSQAWHSQPGPVSLHYLLSRVNKELGENK